jgi:small subunit ribosomal protein S8
MKDFLGDMLTRIKNGQKVQLNSVLLHPSTPKYCIKVLELLRDEGFIYGYQEWYDENTKKKVIKVLLKYNNTGVPVIRNIFRVSKPGRRVFLSTKAL